VFNSARKSLLPPPVHHPAVPRRCLWAYCLFLLVAASGCGPAPGVSNPAHRPGEVAVAQVTPSSSPTQATIGPNRANDAETGATPAPAVTAPTASPTATSTPSASVTPAATATAGTTAPPTPTRTPPASATSTATATPVWEPPAGANPLTGERVANPAVLERRPIAIKISNYPPQVRPQFGLNNADLIFEHYAEVGVTRFTAVFYSRDAERVGSIRSGRLIDLEIPVMYDAAFAYSGAVGPIRLLIRDSVFFSRVISPDFAHAGFFRVEEEDRAFEHTLYTDTRTLRHMLEARGENRPPLLQTHMSFQPEAPEGGTAASQLEIRYLGTNAFWQYNTVAGRYTRWTDGRPHLDAASGQQLSFKNIVVVAAHHQETEIVEDRGGNLSLQIQIWGDGPVSIFRDGRRYDGRWRRLESGDMLTFYDGDGHALPLAPGNTVFQLVPLGFTGLWASP
jgi:hypothetical protein